MRNYETELWLEREARALQGGIILKMGDISRRSNTQQLSQESVTLYGFQ